MSSTSLRCVVAAVFVFVSMCLYCQVQRHRWTDKGEIVDTPIPHPLSWWTQNPLRLDASGDLLIGRPARDGHIVTAQDYRVKQTITHLGVIAGRQIVQILTTITPRTPIVSSGWASAGQWKSLLVQSAIGKQYTEIYELQSQGALYQPPRAAAIYGVGPDAILGTYDPDAGNGGGCADGYWWIDLAGVHPVDFSPLTQAINRSLPQKSTYTPNCSALRPIKAELRSWVQRSDAKCHACGGLGQIEAHYRIKRGAAIPISVRFSPVGQE